MVGGGAHEFLQGGSLNRDYLISTFRARTVDGSGRVIGCPEFAGIYLVLISISGLLCSLVEKIPPPL